MLGVDCQIHAKPTDCQIRRELLRQALRKKLCGLGVFAVNFYTLGKTCYVMLVI
jgi:hypothetical protein